MATLIRNFITDAATRWRVRSRAPLPLLPSSTMLQDLSPVGERLSYEPLSLPNVSELRLNEVEETPTETKNVEDDLIICTQCHISLDVHGVCGLCYATAGGSQPWEEPDDPGAWVECSVTSCRAQYVRADVEPSEVTPRCWYCRNNQTCPFIECTQCSNRTIVPPLHRATLDLSSYLCVRCRNPSEPITTDEQHKPPDPIAELDTCAICCADTLPSDLLSACGQPDCQPTVDDACLQTWYGANQLGCLPLNIGQLLCPFCRRVPTAPTIIKYNPPASVLTGLQEALEDHEFLYGWCEDCACAKRALPRTCGADGSDDANGRNFVCEECLEVRKREAGTGIRFTPCPKCGVYVEKTSGCNHITCECGADFCHVCGIESTDAEIYAHMDAEHGGMNDEDAEEQDDD